MLSLPKTMKTPMFAAVLVSAASAVVTGCATPAETGSNEDPSVGHVIQPIIHGTASGTGHDSVVVLGTFAGGKRMALCSATLVAPNLVVTARHCVSNTEGSTACSQDGTAITGGNISGTRVAGSLAIFTGKNGRALDSNVEANAAAHGKRVIVDASTNVCNRDLAFVVLDQDVDAPVSAIRIGAPSPSETVSVVGWGVDETGSLSTSREYRDVGLAGVGPAPHPINPAWGYGDREFMTTEAACAGDSGGPALAASGAVVGVAARTGNGKSSDGNYATTCMGPNARTVFTHLAKFENLINASFKEAGRTPWLEGEPSPYAPAQSASSSSSGSSGSSGAGGGEASSGKPAADGPPVVSASADADLLGDDDTSGPTAAPESAAAAGCSMTSGEAPKDNVAYAAGVVALLALILGLRRRFKKDAAYEPPPARDPYESTIREPYESVL